MFVFLSLEEGRWGKGNICECGSLFVIFCVSLFFLFGVCPVPAFRCCIHSKGASWLTAVAHPPWVHGGEEGQSFVDKEAIQNSGNSFNML